MADLKTKIVEVCIFTRNQSEPKYLLLKRSVDNEIYPGIWQFVTGGIRENEKVYEAALREVREETDLPVDRCFVTQHVTVFYDAGYDAVNLSPLFAAEVVSVMNPRLSREHSEFRWCTYDEARELLVWHGQKQGLDIINDYIIGNKLAGKLLEITGKTDA